MVSISPSFLGLSFTCVGKPAPPIPTTPASLTSALISPASSSSIFLVCGSASTASYKPSFSTIIALTFIPVAVSLGSILFTVPETDEWILADMKACPSAIFCPISTLSPFATRGTAGAPICCDSIKTSSFPGFSSSIGVSLDIALPSKG